VVSYKSAHGEVAGEWQVGPLRMNVRGGPTQESDLWAIRQHGSHADFREGGRKKTKVIDLGLFIEKG